MISTRRLTDILEGEWAVFDGQGNPVARPVPQDVGPAALLVTDLTDALKRVDGADRIVDSVDRTNMWSVEAIVLNSVALRRLEDAEFSVEGLIEAVRAAGLAWQIRPISVL
jgi:hypothetical protein